MLWLLVCICFAVMGSVSQGAEKYRPVDKVEPGMKGEALTVFHGTKIEKFEVKVLAVVAGEFEGEKLILVRLSGKTIEECGGLAAGMSGSPVYIRGDLVGAISYGFENADPFLAYVTPIQTMRKLLDNRKKITYRTYYRNSRLIPVNTPVTVSGMGQRGFALVSRSLREFGLTPVFFPGSGGYNPKYNENYMIKPGGAIAVQLVSGDYHASAIGTVTMVDGKNFLAFGHPFTNLGNTDLLAFKAEIQHIVKSPVISMKIGTPLSPLGRIFVDRHAGIAGRFGEFPEMITVQMNVKDLERNTVQNSNFQVINDEQLYHDLISNVATAAIDRAIDRIGSGTAKVVFKIHSQDGKRLFTRENMFYNKDIAVAAMKEFGDVINAYATNEFIASNLRLIQIDVEVDKQNNSASLQRLEVEPTKVKPGETVSVKTRIHSFRGKDTTVNFDVKLPESIAPGRLTLMVRGVSEKNGEFGEKSGKNSNLTNKKEEIGSFDELLNSIAKKPKNNELILEYYSMETNVNPQAAGSKQTGATELKRLGTEHYLVGEAKVEIEVEKR